MNFNFAQALAALGANAAFEIANEARPPSDYLYATLLPERNVWSYDVSSGSMTVRTTMAGLAAMDSPYPEGGTIELSTFMEQTAKIANRVRLPEAALRQLQNMIKELMLSNMPTLEVLQREALNFLDKLIVQAHLDTMEWLRGQALANGAINWTFNKKALVIDYGIPTANKLTARTGNDAYGGSASKFWTDVRAARRLLKRQIRAAIVHPDLLDDIVYNSANAIWNATEGDNGAVTITMRAGGQSTADRQEESEQYRITLIPYGREAEIMDLTNPGQTVTVPFHPRTKIVFVGSETRPRFIVGEGSTPEIQNALGYTHLAPTVEGGGRPGRWAELFVPQDEPWSIEARGVTNALPVVESPDRIVIATSDVSS